MMKPISEGKRPESHNSVPSLLAILSGFALLLAINVDSSYGAVNLH